ncbi:MAG: hypothetical protein WEB00_03250 [Dehalococcoidia bacterium]
MKRRALPKIAALASLAGLALMLLASAGVISMGSQKAEAGGRGPGGGGTIIIAKLVSPDDPQDFTYSGDLGNFTLDEDPSSVTPRQSRRFDFLVDGTYVVTEAALAGWGPISIRCLDPSGGTTVDLANLQVSNRSSGWGNRGVPLPQLHQGHNRHPQEQFA